MILAVAFGLEGLNTPVLLICLRGLGDLGVRAPSEAKA